MKTFSRILFGLMATFILGTAGESSAQTDCSKCTSNDFIISQFFIGDINSNLLQPCVSGEPVTSYLWVQVVSNATRYSLYVEYNLKITEPFTNVSTTTHVTSCLYENAPIPRTFINLGDINWVCGQEVEILNFSMSWKQNISGACGWNTPKCLCVEQVVIVNIPLSVGFQYNLGCNLGSGTPVSFNSVVDGGDGNYTYFWAFGDGATSTAANPIHSYANPGVYVVSLTVIDGTGATLTYSQNVTVPNLIQLSAEQTFDLQCENGNTAEGYFAATGGQPPYSFEIISNNTNAVFTQTGNVYSFSGAGAGNILVRVYDAISCQAEATLTINWLDNEAPVITTEEINRDLGCNPGEIIPPVFTGTDDYEGIIIPVVTTSGASSTGCNYIQTWYANYTDACGFAAEQMNITWTWTIDTEKPLISTTAQSGDLGYNPIVEAPVFTGSDNCDGTFEPLVSTDGPTSENCDFTQTWTASYTDACGNIADEVSITYTWIDDDELPVISTLAEDTDFGCNPTSITAPEFTGFDGCSGPFTPVVSTDGPSNTGCIYTQTWTASFTDAQGNVAEPVSITYTWTIDTELPVISTVAESGDLGCNPTAITAPEFTGLDNCEGAFTPDVATEGPTNDGCTYTLTWTATYTDDCGNIALPVEITYTWTIDTELPVISTVAESGDLGCNPTAITAPEFTGLDNCEGAFTPDVATAGPTNDGCAYTQTWTATYTDDCGNIALPVEITYTWTIDTELPVISTVAESGDLGCNPTAITAPEFTGLDNCEGAFAPNVATEGPTNDGCAYTQTWIATYTDECGNIATPVEITYTWTVDITEPVFEAIADATYQCIDDMPVNVYLGWTDNCDGAGEVLGTDVSDGNTCPETITRTWTYTDACGNTASVSQIITIHDLTPPVFTVVPEFTVVECDGNGNGEELTAWLNSAVAEDNCGVVSVTNNFQGLNDLCGSTGLATVTWTAVDECGNFEMVTATFAIFDYTAPVFNIIPQDIIVSCDGNGNAADLNTWLENVSAIDACSEVTITNNFTGLSDLCGTTGIATVTWTATDDCNNSVTTSATFTIIDEIAPYFTLVPEDLTVNCDENSGEALENWLANVAASDLCGEVVITNDFVSLSDLCGETGAATVTWTATDDCGNIATTSATFTIIDETAPVFTIAPSNITVECDGNGNVQDLENWLTNVAATDNCGEVTVTNNFSGLSNLCGATGAATVTFTATDECGNTATASAVFTIVDTQAPSLTCPPNITVDTQPGLCGSYVQVPIPNTDDDCSGVSIVNSYTGTPIASGYYPIGTTIVIWTSTDACGNSSTCEMTVTVVDNEDPQITCPEDITVNNDQGVCEAYVTVPEPEVSDNCEISSVTNSYTQTVNASAIYPVGTTVVVWTVVDEYGNSATCTMNVTVVDNEAPTIICPEDIAVNTDTGVCGADVTVPQPVVSDNCGIESLVNSFNGTDNASGFYPAGTTIVTWIVTDIHGNTAECSMNVVVADNEAPVIICPEDVAVNTDPGVCEANVTVSQPEVSDNCGIESIVNDYNGTSDASGIYPVGTTTVSWIVTDIHGLTAECSMVITVTDNEAPVIECPENISVNTDQGVCEAYVEIPQPVVSDNCGIESIVNSFNGSVDASGIYPTGTTTITWTVTDIHGLIATCEMTVTVADNEMPVIECPEDMTMTAGTDCNAVVEIPVPVVSDNCGIENLVNSYNNTGNASGSYPVGIHTITWTVTDIHGNTATCEMQLTVVAGPVAVDDYATTPINVPVNIAVLLNDSDCDNNIDPSTVTVTSNPANGFTMVDSQTGEVLYTPNSGYFGTDTFIYRVCDFSGLCDEAVVTITIVNDNPIYLVAINDMDTTLVNTPRLIINMANDIIPAGVTAAIEILTPTVNGSVTLNSDMTVTYTPAADFIGEDQFTYILYDVNGIAVSDTAISVIVIVPDEGRPDVVIYNGITPNGDGRNDTWIIDGIEEYPDNEILLFNRWSDQIREFTGYNNSSVVWDGTNQFGKKLPDGTYYYIVKLRSINQIYTGWVIIHGSNN
ncbi:MAG: HYR domain-containing protein [Lentimicrobium sp.]|nr:HYR domain-containing protein [Lentimicrobium sp.]